MQSDWLSILNWDQVLHTKVWLTSPDHEWESSMTTHFGSMGWDFGKELGWANMEARLQRQVPTILKLK